MCANIDCFNAVACRCTCLVNVPPLSRIAIENLVPKTSKCLIEIKVN